MKSGRGKTVRRRSEGESECGGGQRRSRGGAGIGAWESQKPAFQQQFIDEKSIEEYDNLNCSATLTATKTNFKIRPGPA